MMYKAGQVKAVTMFSFIVFAGLSGSLSRAEPLGEMQLLESDASGVERARCDGAGVVDTLSESHCIQWLPNSKSPLMPGRSEFQPSEAEFVLLDDSQMDSQFVPGVFGPTAAGEADDSQVQSSVGPATGNSDGVPDKGTSSDSRDLDYRLQLHALTVPPTRQADFTVRSHNVHATARGK